MPATHGYQCGGKAYPTACAGCKEAIFYFHCDHGSKVFFDELGGTWPKHECKAWNSATRLLSERTIHTTGRGCFEAGAFPGILVWNGGYTRAVSPIVPALKMVKCNRCGVLRADPKGCVCKGRALTREQDERRRAERKLARGIFRGPEHKQYLEDTVSGRRKQTSIGTIAAPRIRTKQ